MSSQAQKEEAAAADDNSSQQQNKEQAVGAQQLNTSVANVSNEAAYEIGNCSFEQLVGVTYMDLNMFDECPHSSEKKQFELEQSPQHNENSLNLNKEGNFQEWAHKEENGGMDDPLPCPNDKSPSQTQEGILNLNSDIFEYCCFNEGDDLLMLYPAQNHFIEEYDPEDQYEIQDHYVTSSSNKKNNVQKNTEESASHQSCNIVNKMSNLNLSGCATTDLSQKSSKNAQVKKSSGNSP